MTNSGDKMSGNEEEVDEKSNEVMTDVEESETSEKDAMLIGQLSGSLSGEISATVLEGSAGGAGSPIIDSEKNERKQYILGLLFPVITLVLVGIIPIAIVEGMENHDDWENCNRDHFEDNYGYHEGSERCPYIYTHLMLEGETHFEVNGSAMEITYDDLDGGSDEYEGLIDYMGISFQWPDWNTSSSEETRPYVDCWGCNSYETKWIIYQYPNANNWDEDGEIIGKWTRANNTLYLDLLEPLEEDWVVEIQWEFQEDYDGEGPDLEEIIAPLSCLGTLGIFLGAFFWASNAGNLAFLKGLKTSLVALPVIFFVGCFTLFAAFMAGAFI